MGMLIISLWGVNSGFCSHLHDRTEKWCAASTSRCPIQNLRKQVSPVVPYKALGNFLKALYGTTGGSCSA